METREMRARRFLLRAAVGLPAGGLLAACGGGGGGGSDPAAVLGASSTAPVPSTLSPLDAATYMVGMTFDSQGRERTILIGTGWAVDTNLLATNGHVVDAINDTARNLGRANVAVKRVSAYQSETGREVAILRAANHPSWNRSTRSPDVGLLETRTALPSVLTLEAPDGTTRLRKGDPLQLNGFPGDVFELVNADFQPGLSVPRSSLFSGTIQAIEHFDARVVVDPANLSTVDMYQHSMDTSGGTSGSPILSNGKVVAIHNSGLQQDVQIQGPNNQPTTRRIAIGTGSWGVHVKHVHNLLAFYRQGVLDRSLRFEMPPPPNAGQPAPGQGATAGGAGQAFRGAVTGPANGAASHQLQISVDAGLRVTGTSQWPAQQSGNPPLPARSFQLSGASDAAGRFEFVDDTPERIPGFRRGVYLGAYNSASGRIVGEYYEFNAATQELFYFGDWSASR